MYSRSPIVKDRPSASPTHRVRARDILTQVTDRSHGLLTDFQPPHRVDRFTARRESDRAGPHRTHPVTKASGSSTSRVPAERLGAFLSCDTLGGPAGGRQADAPCTAPPLQSNRPDATNILSRASSASGQRSLGSRFEWITAKSW